MRFVWHFSKYFPLCSAFLEKPKERVNYENICICKTGPKCIVFYCHCVACHFVLFVLSISHRSLITLKHTHTCWEQSTCSPIHPKHNLYLQYKPQPHEYIQYCVAFIDMHSLLCPTHPCAQILTESALKDEPMWMFEEHIDSSGLWTEGMGLFALGFSCLHAACQLNWWLSCV